MSGLQGAEYLFLVSLIPHRQACAYLIDLAINRLPTRAQVHEKITEDALEVIDERHPWRSSLAQQVLGLASAEEIIHEMWQRCITGLRETSEEHKITQKAAKFTRLRMEWYHEYTSMWVSNENIRGAAPQRYNVDKATRELTGIFVVVEEVRFGSRARGPVWDRSLMASG